MDSEFQLTITYIGAGLAGFAVVAVLVRFMQWSDTMRGRRSTATCAFAFVVGLALMLADIMTVSLDIPTPFGPIDAAWVGIMFIVVSVLGRILTPGKGLPQLCRSRRRHR